MHEHIATLPVAPCVLKRGRRPRPPVLRLKELVTLRAGDPKMAQLMSMLTFSGRRTPLTLDIAFGRFMEYCGRNAKSAALVTHQDGRQRLLVTRPGTDSRSKPPEEIGSSKAVGAALGTFQKVLVVQTVVN